MEFQWAKAIAYIIFLAGALKLLRGKKITLKGKKNKSKTGKR